MKARLRSVGPSMLVPVALVVLLMLGIVLLLAQVPLTGVMLFHAGAMIIAWGIFVPMGVILARYFKITRQQDFPAHLDNGFWWNWHRGLQYTGVVLSTLGFFAMVSLVGFKADSNHTLMGLVVVIIGWLQVLSGWFRGSKGGPTEPTMRGDHYDMTLRRHIFQGVHKTLGWSVLALAFSTIWTGMDMMGFPTIGFILLCGGASVFVLTAIIFQRQGRKVSTYRAIWGKEEPARDNSHQSVAVTPPST
jgi:hypothetical protein